MAQYGFYFDGTRCTGCRTCVLACKDYNDLSTEIAFRNLIEYGGGTWQQAADKTWSSDTFIYHISIACNHCDNPACMAQCPQDAISKDADTGIVTSDPSKCIGCGTCVAACPYGAPSVDPDTQKSVKCDMCSERLAAGSKPICVEACSLRALDFGLIEDLRAAYGDVAGIAPLPDESETSPNLVIKVPANSKPVTDKTGSILNAMDMQ